MAQKLPITEFLEKTNEQTKKRIVYNYKLIQKLICFKCVNKPKKRNMCLKNNASYLNLDDNTCTKFVKKNI